MKNISSSLRKMGMLLSFTFSLVALLIMIFLLFGASGCTDKVEITRKYTYMTPVYTTTAEVRNAFEFAEPEVINNPGKIYYLNHHLFVNEPGEGIHVVDNTDPAQPKNVGFIHIPGNYDMAGKGNVLYADSYIDLLAIDISDINNIKILNRVENVFPIQYDIYYVGETGLEPAIITNWQEEEYVEVFDSEIGAEIYPGYYSYRGGFVTDASFNNAGGGSVAPPPTAGSGGSMARFAVSGTHLYTIDSYQMRVFDITNIPDPQAGNVIDIGWNIETIFPYKENLFIGSQSGMFIYDNSNPNSPALLSTFEHVQSCDPVVVNDTMAYVTLRSGNECQGFTNQLDVIDIRDLANPQLRTSFAMENPHGLGIDGTTLFVCEGEFGLKIFDAANTMEIDQHQLAHYKSMHAYDVIPVDGVLMVIGEDGIYQYDYKNPENIQMLSALPVIRK